MLILLLTSSFVHRWHTYNPWPILLFINKDNRFQWLGSSQYILLTILSFLSDWNCIYRRCKHCTYHLKLICKLSLLESLKDLLVQGHTTSRRGEPTKMKLVHRVFYEKKCTDVFILSFLNFVRMSSRLNFRFFERFIYFAKCTLFAILCTTQFWKLFLICKLLFFLYIIFINTIHAKDDWRILVTIHREM